jgi:hypothetical protein
MTVLVHRFLLGGVAFWIVWSSGVVMVVDVLLLLGWNTVAGLFIFLFFGWTHPYYH